MTARELAPSPVAQLLLELADRRADGSVDIGGRRVVLRAGSVVDVSEGNGDIGLEEFLLRAGRITQEELSLARADADRTGDPVEDALLRHATLGIDALREARRALWLERLVRGLSIDEAEGRTPAFLPEPPEREPRWGAPAVPLLLDALARRAGSGDAEAVGSRADHRIKIVTGPHRETALTWARIQVPAEDAPQIAQVLAAAPAAAAPLAALVRAGLAHVIAPRHSAPPPPPRPPSLPPARTTTLRPSMPSRPPAASIPPPREPELRLDPGTNDASSPPPLPDALEDRFPAFVATLDDPLDAAERRVQTLEQAGASGPERAAAWREVAMLWHTRHHSLVEAARAWREAAAADPRDRAALDHAATLCAAMGEADLAVAYASASAALASDGPTRARAFGAVARLAARAGDVDAQRRALMQAASADPKDASAPLLLAHLALEAGDRAEAVTRVRAAAERLRIERPDRARAALAWAYALRPDDVELAEAYAAALTADGRPEAAVSLLAEAARQTPDPDDRRRLVLMAAEHAEVAGRPDLAAARLLEAFDAEPHVDMLYEPLVHDLAQSGRDADRAVLLEEMAANGPATERAAWLTRAAEAHLTLPAWEDWGIELATRALISDPSYTPALDLLRAHATAGGEHAILAEALERAIRRAQRKSVDPAVVEPLLYELARVAEDRVGSAHLALWAWEALEASGASGAADAIARLRQKVRVKDGLLQLAENDLEDAFEPEKPRAARRLAAMLRDHPGRRLEAVALYRNAWAGDPDDAPAAAALGRLLRLTDDEPALVDLLRRRTARASGRGERIRLLATLAALEASRGDLVASADACVKLLEVAPESPEAIARLDRLARRLRDPALRRRALEKRAETATAPRARAAALSSLALLLERRGQIDEAVIRAEEALAIDPKATDAVPVLLGHLDGLPPRRAMHAIEAARQAVGDSAPLLALATAVAERAGQPIAVAAFLDAWSRIAPLDAAVARRRLLFQAAGDDARGMIAAAENVLGGEAIDSAASDALRAALERLDALGESAEAAALAIHAVDRMGERDEKLLDLAEALAGQSGKQENRVAALERRVAWTRGEARVPALEALAAIHRAEGDRAAEARTLLRVLAEQPTHDVALARLAAIYAETAETDRFMAVLALRREAAETPRERAERLLDLAAAAKRSGDAARAEAFVRALLEDGFDHAARVSAGMALATLGHDRDAVEILIGEASRATRDQAGPLAERACAIAERTGDDELTLKTALRGLELAPSHGPLLLVFERLAFDKGDVDLARTTYERLARDAMGRHGRRGVLYREARWLERAGDSAAALDAYGRAFDLAPSAGLLFNAIERLASETRKWPALLGALKALASQAPDPDRRLALWQRAALLAERELRDPVGAFALTIEAWDASHDPALIADLRRRAHGLRDRNTASGIAALEELLKRYLALADETWNTHEKMRCLTAAAEIEALDLGQPSRAEEHVEEAVRAATADDIPADLIVRARCALATWLAHGEGSLYAAQNQVRLALEAAPDSAVARHLGEALGIDGIIPATVYAETEPPGPEIVLDDDGVEVAPAPRAPTAFELEQTPAVPLMRPAHGYAMRDAAHSDLAYEETPAAPLPAVMPYEDTPPAPLEPVSVPEAAETETAAPSNDVVADGAGLPAAEALALDEAALREASRTGDPAATEALAALLVRDPTKLHEASQLLRALYLADPGRTSALRALTDVARRVGADALAEVSSAIVSMFDPSVAREEAPHATETAEHFGPAESALHDVRHAAIAAALKLVWEGALPLFRKTLRDYGVVGTDRVFPHTQRRIAKIYVDAAKALDLERVPMYLRATTGRDIVVVPTQPPAVIASASIDDGEVGLRFRVGRALELARTEHVVVAALPPDEVARVLEAVRAAFGPADGSDGVPREPAALAADLWRTMPSRTQVQLRDLLGPGDLLLDPSTVLEAVKGAGARAGLLVEGDVRIAIEALARDDEDLRGAVLESEQGFSDACRKSPALAALVRFALGDAWVAARSRSRRRGAE